MDAGLYLPSRSAAVWPAAVSEVVPGFWCRPWSLVPERVPKSDTARARSEDLFRVHQE